MKLEDMDIEELLEQGHSVQVKPRGYSMYPMLIPGRDEVVLEQAKTDSLRRGDVVLYRRVRDQLVLHRIWKKNGNEFYMVGDNQTEVEGPLRGEQIKGRLVYFVRKGRKIDAKNPFYRVVSAFWLSLRPLRPGVSSVVHSLKKAAAVLRK